MQDVREGGEEMIEVKRLADEGGAHSGPIMMSRAHQDDWCRVSMGCQPRREANTVETRHLDVTQHHVRWAAQNSRPGLLAVVGTTNSVSRLSKELGEQVTQTAVIIDDQN